MFAFSTVAVKLMPLDLRQFISLLSDFFCLTNVYRLLLGRRNSVFPVFHSADYIFLLILWDQ